MFLKIVMHDGEYTADEGLAIALLAVAANKTPQVVRTNDPKTIQEALEDKNVYVLGGGRTSPLRKNFDGDVLPLVVKYLEGYFPEGWQAPESGQVPLTGGFSADLARAIELIKRQAL